MQEMKPHMKNSAVTVMKAKRLSVLAGVFVIGLVTDRKLDFVDHEPDVVLQREWGMKT
jgi:hypothetical protein